MGWSSFVAGEQSPIFGNHLAWQFRIFAVPCFRACSANILADVLSGYANIDEHARRVAQEAYRQMGAQYAGEDDCGDPGEVAEAASKEGQIYNEMMAWLLSSHPPLHCDLVPW